MSLKTYVTNKVVDHVLEKTSNIPNAPPNAKIANNFNNYINTHYLDNGFCSICGIRIGLEPIIGCLPVIGDFMGVWLSLMLVKKSREINLPQFLIFLMLLNIFVDFMLSLTPFLGDFIDFLYKANSRNVIILEQYLISKTKNKTSKIENGSIGFQEKQNN
ncbi:7456_t:CDS:2 [Entrophospora sp. SA101]|nr:7456_t:CDS:2 [Entrophospora sp. SA101]